MYSPFFFAFIINDVSLLFPCAVMLDCHANSILKFMVLQYKAISKIENLYLVYEYNQR